jgi:hypothetical protein
VKARVEGSSLSRPEKERPCHTTLSRKSSPGAAVGHGRHDRIGASRRDRAIPTWPCAATRILARLSGRSSRRAVSLVPRRSSGADRKSPGDPGRLGVERLPPSRPPIGQAVAPVTGSNGNSTVPSSRTEKHAEQPSVISSGPVTSLVNDRARRAKHPRVTPARHRHHLRRVRRRFHPRGWGHLNNPNTPELWMI